MAITPRSRILPFLCCLTGLFLPLIGLSQDPDSTQAPSKGSRIKGETPNQNDIWKIDILQCGVNEVRFFYESQRTKRTSIELGAGYIFPNRFWYERGDRPMLGTGFGLYFGYRIYMDKKHYFTEPKLRSYFNPMVFYRFSTYENEWFTFTTANPQINDCLLQSERIHQAAALVRFGWQTYKGRLAVDFYSGLGFKFIPSTRDTHVYTPETATCGVTPNSVAVSITEKFYGTNVILNAGVKLGLRRNNKVVVHEPEIGSEPGSPDPDAPPQF